MFAKEVDVMNVNIESFGATVGIGVFVFLGIVLLLYCFFPPRPFRWAKLPDGLSPTVAGLLAFALSFPAGLLMEDLSNMCVDVPGEEGEEATSWAHVLRDFVCPTMPSEEHCRAAALCNSEGKATPLGKAVAKLQLLERFGGGTGRAVERTLLSKESEQPVNLSDLKGAASGLYYHAKNTVYLKPTYYDDMQQVQTRIDFVRAFTVGSFFLFLAAIVCGVVAGIRSRVGANTEPSSQLKLRAFLLIPCFYVCFLGGRFVFAWEEVEFDKLAYGYFTTMQATSVDPGAKSGSTGELHQRISYSGLAALGQSTLLAVHDEKANDLGHRLGVLTVVGGKDPMYTPVCVVWSSRGDRPSDLESICAIPGRNLEFLAAESGGYYEKGKYGRVFHVQMFNNNNTWTATIKGVIPLPRDTENVEGIACVATRNGSLLMILAERGGGKKNAQGKLRWGRLDLGSYTLDMLGEKTFAAPDWPDATMNRDCADLFIDEDDRLWIVATEDSGDVGPFRSVIYNAGCIAPDDPDLIHLHASPKAVWHLDGLKVEAIGPGIVQGSQLTFGTDDENYGGIWRPLFGKTEDREARGKCR